MVAEDAVAQEGTEQRTIVLPEVVVVAVAEEAWIRRNSQSTQNSG